VDFLLVLIELFSLGVTATLPLIVFTQINFVADFLQAKCDFRQKSAVLRFETPFGRATYDDHLRLIGKCVVDFLLMLIELFSLGATGEYRLKIGDFAPTGAS